MKRPFNIRFRIGLSALLMVVFIASGINLAHADRKIYPSIAADSGSVTRGSTSKKGKQESSSSSATISSKGKGAYGMGTDLPSTPSTSGKRLLAHELIHVVQQ